MPHVKDQFVLRRVKHIVQTHNQFHGAKTGRQMPRIVRAAPDDVVPDLAAERSQFLYIQSPEVFRRIDLI